MAARWVSARVLVSVVTICHAGFVGAQSEPPNIIFVLLDDAGYGDFGSFHQNHREAAADRSRPFHLTPNIDSLARDGAQLRQHYCPAPVCAPSRASLMLGVHQGHANLRDSQFDKALEDNWTLPRVLKHAGYATCMLGKHGLQGVGESPEVWPTYPTTIGFDYYLGQVRHEDGHTHYPAHETYDPYNGTLVRKPVEVWENDTEISSQLHKCYSTDLYVARAKHWIVRHRELKSSQPFFLFISLPAPHAAFQVPTQAYPSGGGIHGGLQWLGTAGKMVNTAGGTIDSYIHPDYATASYDHDSNSSTGEIPWPDIYRRFATMMRRIDDGIGDLRQTLVELGIDQNTLVVLTSDNGPTEVSYLSESPPYGVDFFKNNGPFRGTKRQTLEGGIRMPAIAWWPQRIPAGQLHTQPSQFHDWMPTFADAAGLPSPARSDGVSLLPSLTGVGTQHPSLVYIEWQDQQVIFCDGYKGRRSPASATTPFEIYDVKLDLGESNNLANLTGYEPLQRLMQDRVLQVRRPSPDAPRAYDQQPIAALQAATVPGVDLQIFEKSYPYLPDFRFETPSSIGTAAMPGLEKLTRQDDIGVLYEGFVQISSPGAYTFHLSADTGAYLRIHEASVIDAGYNYASGTERSGTISLATGLHPFRLSYARQGAGVPRMSLEWSGPGFQRQQIPEAAWRRADTKSAAGGVRAFKARD